MSPYISPAIQAFVRQLKGAETLGQVIISHHYNSFRLRHVHDESRSSGLLRQVVPGTLRNLAQFDSRGSFRPLKSAPDLIDGWECEVGDPTALEFALNSIYPGAVADWYAVHHSGAVGTDFREFIHRQTGIYASCRRLKDSETIPVIRACCHRRFCIKRRLWTVRGLPTDSPNEKSEIPCLEPCAIFLEMSRRVTLELEHSTAPYAPPSDPGIDSGFRVGDFANPANPRRLQWLLEKDPSQ